MRNGSKKIQINGRTLTVQFLDGSPWYVTCEVFFSKHHGHSTQRTLWQRGEGRTQSKLVAEAIARAA